MDTERDALPPSPTKISSGVVLVLKNFLRPDAMAESSRLTLGSSAMSDLIHKFESMSSPEGGPESPPKSRVRARSQGREEHSVKLQDGQKLPTITVEKSRREMAKSVEHLYDVPLLVPLNGSQSERLTKSTLLRGSPEDLSSHRVLRYASEEMLGPSSENNEKQFKYGLQRKMALRGKSSLAQYKDKDGRLHNKVFRSEQRRQKARARAIIYRESTLASKNARPKPDNLFEIFLSIDIDLEGVHLVPVPKIIYQFPHDAELDANVLPTLLYPDYKHTTQVMPGTSTEDAPAICYASALCSKTGERAFAYCYRFNPLEGDRETCFFQRVVCFITNRRHEGFYFELARHAVSFMHDKKIMTHFLSFVQKQDYPVKGTQMVVAGTINETALRVESMAPLSQIVSQFTPEWTTSVIVGLLMQQRILIAGKDVAEVSRLVMAMDSALLPLEWPHTLILTIPDEIPQIAHNPTPYLMGMTRKNLDKILPEIYQLEDKAKEDAASTEHDWAFYDSTNGLIHPLPQFFRGKDRAHYREKECLVYCEEIGMPHQVAADLLKYLRKALSPKREPSNTRETTTELDKCVEAVLRWYAKMFGHYRSVISRHPQWNDEAKAALLAEAHSNDYRHYLEILVETHMFQEWIKAKMSGVTTTPGPDQRMIEALHTRLDELYDEYAEKKKRNVKYAIGRVFGRK